MRCLDEITFDRNEVDGQLFGFIESSPAMHKTSTTSERKCRQMPLVCPLLGVTGLDWTSSWIKAAEAVGFNFGAKPLGALCRAFNNDGNVSVRSCASNEVTKLLNAFFGTDDSNRITSHSLKETTLAWSARYGMDESCRTLLGHHELAGSRSLATYSRDMLSRPLQQYCAMLMNIRNDYFRPDVSRSGWLSGHAARPADPPSAAVFSMGHASEPEISPGTPVDSESKKAPDLEPDADDDGDEVDSASSDSSSSETDGMSEERLTKECFIKEAPEVGGPLFQNKKTKVLHRVGEPDSHTRCGITAGYQYEFLKDGSSLRWARCGRCFKGEVISNAEIAVQTLDALKSARLDKSG